MVEASVLLLLVVQHGRQQHLLLHAPRPHEGTWWTAGVTPGTAATAGRPFAARRDTSRPVTDAEVRLEAGRAAERGWCCLGQPRLQTDTFHAREHPTLAIRLQTQTAEGSSCDMHGWGLVAH
jgi:hypothetical protein